MFTGGLLREDRGVAGTACGGSGVLRRCVGGREEKEEEERWGEVCSTSEMGWGLASGMGREWRVEKRIGAATVRERWSRRKAPLPHGRGSEREGVSSDSSWVATATRASSRPQAAVI